MTATIRPRTFASTKYACGAETRGSTEPSACPHPSTSSSSAAALVERSRRAASRRRACASSSSSAAAGGSPLEYPRKPTDAWIFSQDEPARHNGWLDMRFFRGMTVAQAAGVGGGSLTYSSVAVEASPDVFTQGWPAEITLCRAETALRHGRAGNEPAGHSRRPVDAALPARPRGRAESGPLAIDSRKRRSPSASPTTGTTSSRTRSIRSTPVSSSTLTGSARAPASIWATATSAATCARRTASTSTTSREPSNAAPTCVRCIWCATSSRTATNTGSCSIASRRGG